MPPESGKQKGANVQKVKQFGNAFLFEMFIEEFYPRFIKQLRENLTGITPEIIKSMVTAGQYPELPAQVYADLHGYEQHLQRITVQRLWKAMVKARPDLAGALDSIGEPGYRWFARFRERLLAGISTGRPLSNAPGEVAVPMVEVSCDVCGKTQIIAKSQAASLQECPFCHAPAGGSDTPKLRLGKSSRLIKS